MRERTQKASDGRNGQEPGEMVFSNLHGVAIYTWPLTKLDSRVYNGHQCSMLLAGDSGTSSAITPGSSLMRHPDRGAGYYFQRRERYGRASLVETGRCAPWATGT